jgi:hypothetical protein
VFSYFSKVVCPAFQHQISLTDVTQKANFGFVLEGDQYHRFAA